MEQAMPDLLKSLHTQIKNLTNLREQVLTTDGTFNTEEERQQIVIQINDMLANCHEEREALESGAPSKDLNVDAARLLKLRTDLLHYRPDDPAEKRKKWKRLRKVDTWLEACEEEILQCHWLMRQGYPEADEILARFRATSK